MCVRRRVFACNNRPILWRSRSRSCSLYCFLSCHYEVALNVTELFSDLEMLWIRGSGIIEALSIKFRVCVLRTTTKSISVTTSSPSVKSRTSRVHSCLVAARSLHHATDVFNIA